ncbi:hypothetical protein Tco_1459222 [Tanacetum coccineum]
MISMMLRLVFPPWRCYSIAYDLKDEPIEEEPLEESNEEAPPSLDRTPSCMVPSGFLGNDSLDEHLSRDYESLHTQTASTSVAYPPPTRPLPTSPAFACRQGKEDLMPTGYRACMVRWFEIGKSSTATTARQPGSALAQGTEYRFVTALEEVNERVTDLATSHRLDSHKMHVRH